MRRRLFTAILLVLACMTLPTLGSLESDFRSPPPSARPWVYWFWLNGNITREGITADLEAMARVGIGGALIMEVDQGAPLGPVAFMSDQWRALFKHVHSEARRLGIEINMNNDAGWNGSGGPWIRPEQSMQKLVWSETEVEGGKAFDGALPQPPAVAGFYRDAAVLAFPTPGAFRIPGIETKAGGWGGPINPGTPGAAGQEKLSPEMCIPSGGVMDLTKQMDASGRLSWDAPAGKWTVIRFGHTSTGAQNGPAHESGRGLECDKLSNEGIEAHFAGMMAKLAGDVIDNAGRGGLQRPPAVGDGRPLKASPTGGLVATHIDSWEVGSQNWTARMREEFKARRGYDLMPYLPAMTGRVVESLEVSERFLWDLRKTVSELVVENYAAHMHKLSNEAGMRFTCEAYGSPCDYLPYAGECDEPMGEFWTPGGAMETCKGMASAGHIYGKPIIGAEAFTADSREKWLQHPGSIKALGDRAFCNGINRFVFHRYAMQPWEPMRAPGMTMGPWGLHYERTNTWWELTGPWHEYLSRCQYMLRQGTFVADILHVQNEAPPQTFRGLARNGYEWDECPAEALIGLADVEDGRIVFPGGMSYRVLEMPESRVMTPELLRKIRELVKAGAAVAGPLPERSPSLSGYPECDEEVDRLARETWETARTGKGGVVAALSAADFLRMSGVPQDFKGPPHFRFIHRSAGGAEIYFVSNQQPFAVAEICAFRVSGKVPELWQPETGRIERAAVYREREGVTDVLLPLGPSGSVFVVFRGGSSAPPPVAEVSLAGRAVLSAAPAPPPPVIVRQAVYGVLDDPARTRDVAERVREKLAEGEHVFQVSDMAAGDDPAYGIVKTLIVEYTCEGRNYTARGTDPDIISLVAGPKPPTPCEVRTEGNDLILTAWERGEYAVTLADGKKIEVSAPALPKASEIGGPWTVRFPGARTAVTRRPASWTEDADADVRHFSGTATYRARFDAPDYLFAEGRVVRLDLGEVREIARVKLNGRDLGILWKQPFVVDVTKALRPGKNELTVQVTNLLVNRMIGDEQLPEDSDRHGNGTLKSWPKWLEEGKPSPTGRATFSSWRLWGKDSPLLPSGLLGPVALRVGYETAVR